MCCLYPQNVGCLGEGSTPAFGEGSIPRFGVHGPPPPTPAPLTHTTLAAPSPGSGWNNVGFHAKSQPNSNEVSTPHIDSLAATGIILDRFYAYRFCSPSRSSFLTGRNCIHVNTGNDPLTLWNPSDPVSGFAVSLAHSQ